ncbi:MAG: hypothetical protein MJZ00_06995 [Paludibacteraceae bacterium]|nr:hypothetical protein [Paludibacteraceae bacterium]
MKQDIRQTKEAFKNVMLGECIKDRRALIQMLTGVKDYLSLEHQSILDGMNAEQPDFETYLHDTISNDNEQSHAQMKADAIAFANTLKDK